MAFVFCLEYDFFTIDRNIFGNKMLRLLEYKRVIDICERFN